MSKGTKEIGELSFSQKFSRLRVRLGNAKWRRYGMLLLAGKALGIAGSVRPDHWRRGLFGVGVDQPQPVHAQETATLRPRLPAPPTAPPPDPYKAATGGDIINPLNTAWVLLGAFLVFGMQAGFTMLEAGFCRNRETVNVLVECMFDTCVCGLLHWGWGFAFMFGGGNAFIGWHLPGDPTKSLIFMKDVSVLTTYGATGHSDPRALSLPVRLR